MQSRRQFLARSCAATSLLGISLPGWARTGKPGAARNEYNLTIREQRLQISGREARATTVDGSLPGTLLRMREGEVVTLRVRNELDTGSSLHWHGILLPPEMDGVPGISFAGIPPGETFTYRFRLKQSGTYWYHSHSGLQEQSGVYAPLIIDPSGPEPTDYDRELVLVLSDWTFEDPSRVFARLKKSGDYYNRNLPSLLDIFRAKDSSAALKERLAWDRMRMIQTDIADVTGYTYSHLLNGHANSDGWHGLYAPGERVRLRVINASAMTYYNLRIPGLPMTVIQADGQNVRPVDVDELQIGVAETVDVIVEPGNGAWPIMAESMDRSGFAFGSLTTNASRLAEAPPLRPRPRRTMADMGHGGHAGMDHGSMDHSAGNHGAMDHAAMDHAAMGHGDETPPIRREPAWQPRRGPGVVNVVDNPQSRLTEPGTGLSDVRHRVLTYAQLTAAEPFYDQRPPTREITLNLTGNMERYMWSFDGTRFQDAGKPIEMTEGERLRLVFINHTMMEHPIHLHGMWMELENGQSPMPRKHTVSVKPAEKLSVLVTADAVGDWAFHCHLLLHMKAGMMRVVSVRPASEAAHDA
jgi:CopA family copper-resistance protein